MSPGRWDSREYGAQTFRTLAARRREFNRVWKWLEAAANLYGRTNTKDGVWERIANGDCQLWSEPEAAVVTTVEVYRDTGLKEVQCWLAGGVMADACRIEQRITAWADGIDADRITISGRRGWLKALHGYDEKLTTMVKELRHEGRR